jgi:hypothetical protein
MLLEDISVCRYATIFLLCLKANNLIVSSILILKAKQFWVQIPLCVQSFYDVTHS